MIGFLDELGNFKQKKIGTFQNTTFFLHFTATDQNYIIQIDMWYVGLIYLHNRVLSHKSARAVMYVRYMYP